MTLQRGLISLMLVFTYNFIDHVQTFSFLETERVREVVSAWHDDDDDDDLIVYKCKLFVLRIVTWSYNWWQRI